jgi:hypothetical protein
MRNLKTYEGLFSSKKVDEKPTYYETNRYVFIDIINRFGGLDVLQIRDLLTYLIMIYGKKRVRFIDDDKNQDLDIGKISFEIDHSEENDMWNYTFKFHLANGHGHRCPGGDTIIATLTKKPTKINPNDPYNEEEWEK